MEAILILRVLAVTDVQASFFIYWECKLNCVSRSAYGSCFAVHFFYCKIKYNDWEVILLAKSKRDQKSAELAKQILENYQQENVEDMQDELRIYLVQCLKRC